MTIDASLPVSEYVRRSTRTPDGIAWLAVCLASTLCLIDLAFGLDVFPLGYASKPGKAAALLIVTPVLGFVNMVRQRQGAYGDRNLMGWFRAAVCIAIFIVLNF